MEVSGFDGKKYKINFIGKTCNKTENRSNLHVKARNLLKELFPFDRLFEEVMLPGSRGLFADFFLPTRRLIVEVHGQQHYEYTNFFYKTKMDFVHAKQRDKNKIAWCELNSIDIIILPYNESEEQWKARLLNKN